jgi:hypothetical protein
MKGNWMEPAYEAARTWALHPVGRPPSGWAQILRIGIATWVGERRPPMPSQVHGPLAPHPSSSPLLTIVAAMIGEVCQ